MRQSVRTVSGVPLVLLALLCLVHCPASMPQAGAQTPQNKAAAPKGQASRTPAAPVVRYGNDKLPRPVLDMREAILAAVQSGRIEDLRHAYELNELKPDLGADAAGDPVAYWKRVSGDGEGREILAVLAELLDAGHVVLPLGPDIENNRLFVWPYFAHVPLDRLTPPQQVELLRLVPPGVAKEMVGKKKYTHWRIVIGADGTWHSFRKVD
jgi:hypothetical protein